jgi:RNA polymerase sigma factor (sigma-70 family)
MAVRSGRRITFPSSGQERADYEKVGPHRGKHSGRGREMMSPKPLRPPAALRRCEGTTNRDLDSLARRAIDGDVGAADELVEELVPSVVRTVRLIVGAGSWIAEDAAQEALIDVMRGIRGVREPRAVRGWAMRVAAARAVKVARRERLRSLGASLEQAPELAATSPLEGGLAALKAAFDQLPPRMRAIAVLRLHAGLSEEETAAAVGCSLGTVKSQFHDARSRLAAVLRAEGFAPTAASAPGPTGIQNG